MPRHNRRRADEPPAADRPRASLGERIDTWHGRDYVVRSLAGTGTRTYRCPGCDQLVGSRQPHVVAWPADDDDADDRRHWHTPCWAARERRHPDVARGRSAPRY